MDILENYREIAEADIDDAQSLPFSAYSSAPIWQLEEEQVFRKEWVFMCSEQKLSKPGDYFAFQLVGEALVIIHGKDGQFRALSNNCRHRGTPLLDEGFGQLDKHIVCPYHAWTYETDGELKAVPLAGKIKVDKKSHCLPEFHLQSWHGLLFINLSENPQPLSQRVQGLDDYIELFELDRFQEGYFREPETWKANWKLAMENAMESYHLFKVHENTLEKTTPTRDAYYLAGSSEWSLTGGRMAQKTSKIMKWLTGDYPEAYDHYVLVSLPPSFVGILTYDSFDWVQVLPIDEQHCEIRSGGISKSKSGFSEQYVKGFVEEFFQEDKDICERVQQGMNSKLGHGGKLVEMERIVADFHQFLARRLFGSESSEFFQGEKASLFLVK